MLLNQGNIIRYMKAPIAIKASYIKVHRGTSVSEYFQGDTSMLFKCSVDRLSISACIHRGYLKIMHAVIKARLDG